MKNVLALFLLITISYYYSGLPLSHLVHNVFAGPSSSNYELKDYSFGGGGDSVSSTNYSVLGVSGEVELGQQSSSNYKAGTGLMYTLMANVPSAPAFTNPDNEYNRLKIVLNNGSNPTDSQFAIAISADNFASDTRYIQNDNTIGASLGLEDWQTYSAWGGASGFYVIGLTPATTYTIKVAAKRGAYTESGFGPTASQATANATLSFDIDVASIDTDNEPPFNISLGNLSAGSVTTSSNRVWVDLSTNGTGGGLVYVYGTNSGLLSNNTSYTISSVSGNLTSLSEGYGARGVSVAETSGGPMQISSPYNGAGDNVGLVDSTRRVIFDSNSEAIVGGRASFELKAKITNVTPASTDYSDTLTVIASGTF